MRLMGCGEHDASPTVRLCDPRCILPSPFLEEDMKSETNGMLEQGFETFDMTANALPSISAGVQAVSEYVPCLREAGRTTELQ